MCDALEQFYRVGRGAGERGGAVPRAGTAVAYGVYAIMRNMRKNFAKKQVEEEEEKSEK
jgi:hypothetical protein